MPKFRTLDWRSLEKVFILSGFRFVRQEGSHLKDGILRPVVIPTHREIPIFIIRTNLKTAGISRDEFFRLLESIG